MPKYPHEITKIITDIIISMDLGGPIISEMYNIENKAPANLISDNIISGLKVNIIGGMNRFTFIIWRKNQKRLPILRRRQC